MTIRRFGQIGGHIPGAVNVSWSKMVNEYGTLKSADELKNLYESVNVTTDKEIIHIVLLVKEHHIRGLF
jgi:3-mercaptopyruvate sulfurtransferase SseA